MHYYTVQVPAYRDKSYTYLCEEQLEPFALVRVPRRQFGSCQIEGNDEWTHGTVVCPVDDHAGREAFEFCTPLRALEDYSTGQLQAEIQRREDHAQAERFGVSVSQYHELREHFMAEVS